MRNARDTVSSWNGRLVLVYLPNKRFSSVFARWDAAGYEAEVVDTARDEGIEVINLVPVFQASENPEGLFRGHYTEEGYRLVAKQRLVGSGLTADAYAPLRCFLSLSRLAIKIAVFLANYPEAMINCR